MTEIENKIGYVYKIVCLNPEITDCYVGSCQSFRTRKYAHKSKCNNLNSKDYNYNVYQFIRAHGGWSNFSMLAIEQVEYTIKHELLVRERFHLERLKASLNKQIPTRTEQEYHKAYYEEHKTEVKQYHQAYYETNKNEINKEHKKYYEEHKTEAKQYYEANKTQISEKNKQKITCACGKISNKCAISRHNKSRRHQNYLLGLPKIIEREMAR
jgi:hypothetical protein